MKVKYKKDNSKASEDTLKVSDKSTTLETLLIVSLQDTVCYSTNRYSNTKPTGQERVVISCFMKESQKRNHVKSNVERRCQQ